MFDCDVSSANNLTAGESSGKGTGRLFSLNQTNLVMKKYLTLLLCAAMTSIYGQSFPFDFESATAGMQGYDGATFTIETNPSAAGNTSANVGKIVKVNVGDLWAGGKIVGLSSLDFSSAASSVLSMKVYTTEPVGTVIKVKLETPYTSEVDAITTVSGAWETLTFDFGIPAPSGSVDLVIMPQPHTQGGGTTFYVDDIQQVAGVIATPRTDLPITFESGTNTKHFFSFESASFKSIPNPDVSTGNMSANVGRLVRHLGAPFGGSKITFANNLDFDNHPVVTMKVWTSAPVGTNVTLKSEKPFWGEERTAQTTKSGEWETLSFDFSGVVADMPTLTFLFDFTAGSTNVGDGSAASTFYFDDVKYSTVPLSTPELALSNFSVYPNPASDQWLISNAEVASFEVSILDLNGKLFDQFQGSNSKVLIDASAYAAGTYLAKITSGQGSQFLKLTKF